jgi:hypothetical protein
VKEERSHQQRSAFSNSAGNWLVLLFPVVNVRSIQPAMLVCTRKYAQRSISFIRLIQMNP